MTDESARAPTIDGVIIGAGCGHGAPGTPRVVSAPVLAALRRVGSERVYADTADVQEVRALDPAAPGVCLAEIDGNTANQPLVARVIDRYLEAPDLPATIRTLAERSGLSQSALVPILYAILCGRIGNDVVRAVAGERTWETSVQLHMRLVHDATAARRVGVLLRRMVPTALVKVPFTPDDPTCLLLARDLELADVPVNLTSTFSARQVVMGALLTNATRTNVFMGRLNQGLGARLLGEHVVLEAQRALIALRHGGIQTRLIVASMREWEAFVRLAGCDVFTAPPAVVADLLAADVPPAAIRSQRATSYADRIDVSARAIAAVGAAGIARLYAVEPEFVAFLNTLRRAPDWLKIRDGDVLARRFDAAGFGDVFHAPSAGERAAVRQSKLPDLDGPLAGRLALDTLYSLHANADFAKAQDAIDARIAACVRASLAASGDGACDAGLV